MTSSEDTRIIDLWLASWTNPHTRDCCRRDAARLRWRNLRARGDAGPVTVYGKNGRTRSVALPAAIWAELSSLKGAAGPGEPVFPSRSGRFLDRGRIRVIVRRAAERVGVTAAVSPHWLRHAHASHALDHGRPVHLVQSTLGHSSVATTSNFLQPRLGPGGDYTAESVSQPFQR